MNRSLSALALTLLLAVPLAADDGAVETARRLETAIGAEAFEKVRLLEFTWAVERDGEVVVEVRHAWDRWTGDYRVEGVDRESGAPTLAVFNIGTRQGAARLGDEELSGEALEGALEQAYGRFINDSYWLLMPFKWQDPGVHLATAPAADDGHDVVELTFDDGTGLTSGDRYYGYVDRESGLMDRWAYVLQTEDGAAGEGEPTIWEWTEWTEHAPGVKLSHSKVRAGEGPAVRIFFPEVSLSTDPDEAELTALFQP